jgi:hypothetical protein
MGELDTDVVLPGAGMALPVNLIYDVKGDTKPFIAGNSCHEGVNIAIFDPLQPAPITSAESGFTPLSLLPAKPVTQAPNHHPLPKSGMLPGPTLPPESN